MFENCDEIRPDPKKTRTQLKDQRNLKKKNKQATPPTTKSPTNKRNLPTLAEVVAHHCVSFAKFIDEDTVEYFSATLLENPCDDDTREMV